MPPALRFRSDVVEVTPKNYPVPTRHKEREREIGDTCEADKPIIITYGRPRRTIGSSQLYRKREKDASKTDSLAQASANAPNPHQTHIWTAKVAQTCI